MLSAINIGNKIKKLPLLLPLLAINANAATYYVAPTGSDTNNGTALTTPVKSIAAGLGKANLSGDIVYVMTGTYAETVTVSQSGITLSAYPGNAPVIDGGTTLPKGNWGDMLFVTGNNNKISGFEVKNSNTTGAYLGGYGVEVSGHHNTLSNMNVHHTWEQGVLIGGDYNTVEDSTVWQASRRNSTNTGQVTSGWGTGMSAARNHSAAAIKPGITSYATFRRNKVYNNWGEGLSCFEADHCTMEDNVVYDNWTVNLYLSDATNSLVQRNLVYVSTNPAIATRNNTKPNTIAMADEQASKPRSVNNTVINNMVYGGVFSVYDWTQVAGKSNSALVANNTIIDGGLKVGGASLINSRVMNNLVVRGSVSVPAITGVTYGNNDYAAVDPKMVPMTSTLAGEIKQDFFKITVDSPLIGKGQKLTEVTEDAFMTARKNTPDIGAHEFSATPVPPTPVPPVPVPPTPTPTPSTLCQDLQAIVVTYCPVK